jgi:uncharacterized membrane protein SpoIIM required for sporulation
VKREPFVAAREERWRRLEQVLSLLERRRSDARAGAEAAAELPKLYRQVCQDLALARRRMYGRELVLHLNRLALAGREQLYRRRGRHLAAALEFVRRGFPRLVREEARLFWLSAALYVVPLAAMIACAHARPDLLYAVLDPEMVDQAERMYDPSQELHPGTGRASTDNVGMFGFYVWNNVSADFRTFAGGILYGLGTILFLVFNGVFHGAIFGHLARIGYGSTLFPFVAGHGSFELTALVISGASGLRLGAALVAPGRRTRARALTEVGPRCLRLLAGAGGMTVMAAFVEAFWSPSGAPAGAKFAVAACLWTAVAVYFLFAGRRDGA